MPNHALAFWFFSTNASAAGTIVPTSNPPMLKAATNIDPNPNKGIGDTIHTSDNAVLAYAGPSGTIADVSSSVPTDLISLYVVRPGDTLSEIATMFGVSIHTIIWANDLSSARDVHPGDTLIILPVSGAEHTIVKGDTLKSIAKKYNADADEIAQFNGLDASASLTVGSSIIIPGGEEAAPAPSSSGSSNARVIHEPYIGGSGAAQDGYYTNPVPGALITQGLHGRNAVDLGAARGTPIHAAAEGIVIIAHNNGAWGGGYGNYLVISHPNGTQTLYAHMIHAIISSGQHVSAGQTIGYLGSTGLSTGPHLHFEVRGAANPFRACSLGTVCAPQ